MDKIVKKLKRLFFLRAKNVYWSLTNKKNTNQECIFIAGMQRSGTNMLMDILEKSFETDVYHERDPRAFSNYQMRGQTTIAALKKCSSAPRFIIKSLCELQDLNKLMLTFEPAKVIWIVRTYDDVVSSMLNSFSNMEKQVIRILKENSDEWLGRGMTEQTRNELKNLVVDGMGDASASAIQWYFRNTLFFDQQFEHDERVMLLSYEDLVNQPEQYVKKICDFIGIKYYPKMHEEIFSSSISRRKQADIEPKIRLLCDSLQLKFNNIPKK